MASSAICHPSPSLSPSPILSSSKLTASPRSTFPSLSFHYRKTCSFLSVRHVPIRDVAPRAAKGEEEEGGGGGNVSVVDKFIARRKKGDDDDEERVKGPAYTPPTNPKVGKALYPRKKDRMRSKRFLEVQKLREEKREYDVKSAIMFLKQMASTKFVESAEAHFRLRLDPKYSDQQLRATVNLPKGTGQKIRIAVIAQGDKLDEAEKAGADIFGGDELINKIKDEGFMDFDKLIAVPEMMPKVASLGRLLGPRGLMPNPKAGTVAADITQAINEFKKGKVEYRLDKAGSVHVIFGKVDFSEQDLMENFMTIVRSIEVNKPKGAKGVYWRSAYVCSTMGPSIRLNTNKWSIFKSPKLNELNF